MAFRFVSLILLSNLLLLMYCDHGYGARKTTEYQWHQSRIHEEEHKQLENDILEMKHTTGDGLDHDQQVTTHDNHMEDPNLGFVTINDLHVGKTLSIIRSKDPSSLPQLLPKEEADTIPFSTKEFPNLLLLFSISQDSLQAKAIKKTLKDCEAKPVKGETKFCATSLESMVDSVRAIFGSKTAFKVVSTTNFKKSNTLQQKYNFLEVKKVFTSNTTVVCHHMPYPYAVFYCHKLEGGTKVFEILLGGDQDGERVKSFFICHMDTSAWSPDHISFHVLGIEHGSPVCHYVFPQSLLWVPS